jgi:hypothetical protein
MSFYILNIFELHNIEISNSQPIVPTELCDCTRKIIICTQVVRSKNKKIKIH